MPPIGSYRVTALCCRLSSRHYSAARQRLLIGRHGRARLLLGSISRVTEGSWLRAATFKACARREMFRRLISKPCTGQCPESEFAQLAGRWRAATGSAIVFDRNSAGRFRAMRALDVNGARPAGPAASITDTGTAGAQARGGTHSA